MKTKSDVIRECIAKYPDADNQEIKLYAAQRGMRVEANLICAVAGNQSTRLTTHRIDKLIIEKARWLIKESGGIKQARNILEIAAKEARYV